MLRDKTFSLALLGAIWLPGCHTPQRPVNQFTNTDFPKLCEVHCEEQPAMLNTSGSRVLPLLPSESKSLQEAMSESSVTHVPVQVSVAGDQLQFSPAISPTPTSPATPQLIVGGSTLQKVSVVISPEALQLAHARMSAGGH